MSNVTIRMFRSTVEYKSPLQGQKIPFPPPEKSEWTVVRLSPFPSQPMRTVRDCEGQGMRDICGCQAMLVA